MAVDNTVKQMETDELRDKAEHWDGLIKIIETMNEAALSMGLHLQTEPLEIPKDYLETSCEYINTFAKNIQLREKIKEIEELVDVSNWIKYGRDEIHAKLTKILETEVV